MTTLFLVSLGLQAQTIDIVTVTGAPVCTSGSIKVGFRLTNGNGSGTYFSETTKYTLSLILNGTTVNKIDLSNVPIPNPTTGNSPNGATVIILDKPFLIPSNAPNGDNYRLLVSSSDPSRTQPVEAYSGTFVIYSTPNAPTVGTITQPTCTTATGSVALSGLPLGNWTINPGSITGSGANKTITGLAAGTYNYTVTNTSGCISSNSANIIINAQPVTPSAPTASNNGPVCVGSTLNLFASTVEEATYSWTGPNRFVSALQNPQVSTNANTAMAGTYSVTVTVDGCTSIEASTNVIVTTNITWTGSTDTNWNNTNNWSCNSLPTLETNVLIPANLASNNYPEINAGTNTLAKNLSIEDGASVLVNDNWLRIAGDLTNSGVLNTVTGSISFEGTSAQNIPIGSFENNRIQNLRIDNTSGVTSEAIIEVTGILTVETGNFNTGNSFTLISDATQTALIEGTNNGQVVGTVKMQRYLDPAFGYKYFSSPFSNSTVGDFSSYMDLVDPVTSFPHFYTYDENREYDADSASTGWKAYTTAAESLEILKGYALNFGSSLTSPKTIEISGNVNNGSQEITLYNNHRLYTKGFNLVGNPYPSPIDWNAPGWTKTNIDDAIYFFTAGSTKQYTGTYTSYVDGISSDGRFSGIIPSMQGFFVHVNDGPSNPPSKVTATLRVTNPVRTDNSIPQEFLKGSEPEKDPLIRISAGYENEVKTDPAVIYFPHFAKLSFEKDKDALKLMNTDITVPNLYSLTPENKKLSINGLPIPGSGGIKKIPLGLKTEKDGWMSIGLQDLQDLPSNFNVYLIDSEKRIGQNLSRKPRYRFFAKSGQHESRFHLMFSETEISDPAIAFEEPFSVKTVGGKVMVSMNLETGQKSILLASTVTGQILDRKNVSEKETVEIEGIKSSGIYFFSINLKDGMFSKKVLIQK
ncbi:MAG: hypothetical protein ACQEWG_00935 [Bacteroidota bacterium]